jgi:OPT family oligopeptide transporter
MIWRSSLPFVALLRTLHEKDTKDYHARHTISRFKLLIILTISQFVYSWLPHYIMPILKQFSWLCMIVPNNRLLAQITGANGFGITSLQLDWYSITLYLSSPVIVPRWAQINLFIGVVLFIWLAGPLIYYLNLWDTRHLPIRSTEIFTRSGTPYDYTLVADDQLRLNMTLYNAYNEIYGPIRLSTMYVVFVASNMAFLPALLVHTLLHHGKWIIQQARTSFSKRNNDIHCKLMAHYLEIPDWCFIVLFCVCLVTVTLVSHFTGILPGYYVLLAVGIGCITVLPYGIFFAQTAQQRLLFIFLTCFLLGAVIVPSNPFRLFAFAELVIRIQEQALTILLYLKISHFMKLPPRVVFAMVIFSTIYSTILSYYISEYFISNIPNLCQYLINPDWGCMPPIKIYSKALFLSIIRKFMFVQETK